MKSQNFGPTGPINIRTPQRFVEATNQTVAWFWKRHQEGGLNMRPPFQRNPVWQEAQKAYLIDTILRGYPVPELYLQTVVSPHGDEEHIVVDGQQRIRSCIEFVHNEFPLGEKSGVYEGTTFDELNDTERRRLFEYRFVVRILPELPMEEIRGIFTRLNRNNEALNRQELRHATYWGEFISCMTDLSKDTFWIESKLFTATDFRRMVDIEYISELAIACLYGPQNKKLRLDRYYGLFEEEFPDRALVEEIFRVTLGELRAVMPRRRGIRWNRKIDFYTLFFVLAMNAGRYPMDRDARRDLQEKLVRFSDHVTEVLQPGHDTGSLLEVPVAARYYARGIRNSSDLNSRRLRAVALAAYLEEQDFAPEMQDPSNSPFLQGAPSVKERSDAILGTLDSESEDPLN